MPRLSTLPWKKHGGVGAEPAGLGREAARPALQTRSFTFAPPAFLRVARRLEGDYRSLSDTHTYSHTHTTVCDPTEPWVLREICTRRLGKNGLPEGEKASASPIPSVYSAFNSYLVDLLFCSELTSFRKPPLIASRLGRALLSQSACALPPGLVLYWSVEGPASSPGLWGHRFSLTSTSSFLSLG